MSDDPLKLGGLDPEVIDVTVEGRKATKGKKTDSAASILRAETAAKKEERIAHNVPATSAPPPPVEPAVEEKSLLLDKIHAYRERFPHLKSRNSKVSGKSTHDEIADELHYLEQQLGQREGHMGHHMFQLALSGVEEITTKHYNPLGLNLMGLSQVARDNQDQFAPILDELFIKYATNMYIGPEMRLVMATATLMYTVHAANTGNPTVARAMEAMSKKVQVPESSKDL